MRDLLPALTRSTTLAAQVTDRLERLIRERRLQPGDRLPSERELAAQTGVSRTVIRDAVRSLAAKGLLEVKAGSGTLIKAPPAETVTASVTAFIQGHQLDLDYARIHEVRRVLEIEIAGLAAERRTDDDLFALHGWLREMTTAQADITAFAHTDVAFHKALAEATHNALFVILLDSIATILYRVRELGTQLPGAADRAIAHHTAILSAIEAGDAHAARGAMHAHLLDSEAIFREAVTPHPESVT
jgi:GntR family transcriptional repressor for pyruvate dehydrogenase complex